MDWHFVASHLQTDLPVGHVQVGRLPGWRFAFLTVAALSFLIGAVTLWLGQDPRKQKGSGAASTGNSREGNMRLSEVAGHMLSVMRVPTFGLLVGQVAFFTVPYQFCTCLPLLKELGPWLIS